MQVNVVLAPAGSEPVPFPCPKSSMQTCHAHGKNSHVNTGVTHLTIRALFDHSCVRAILMALHVMTHTFMQTHTNPSGFGQAYLLLETSD